MSFAQHHFITRLWQEVLKFLMKAVMYVRKEKTNYLIAPQPIISWITVDRTFKIAHMLPSLIVSILIVVKVLPRLFPSYNAELEKNSMWIALSFIPVFIIILIINGFVIEKVLNLTNPLYATYKNELWDAANDDFEF